MASMQMLNSKQAVQLRGSGHGRRQQVVLRAAARQADSLQLAVSAVGSWDGTLPPQHNPCPTYTLCTRFLLRPLPKWAARIHCTRSPSACHCTSAVLAMPVRPKGSLSLNLFQSSWWTNPLVPNPHCASRKKHHCHES